MCHTRFEDAPLFVQEQLLTVALQNISTAAIDGNVTKHQLCVNCAPTQTLAVSAKLRQTEILTSTSV